jgi:hypothetical protein
MTQPAAAPARVSGALFVGQWVHYRGRVSPAGAVECVAALVVRVRVPTAEQAEQHLHDVCDLRAYYTPATWPPPQVVTANGQPPPGSVPADPWLMIVPGADAVDDEGRWHYIAAHDGRSP